MIMINQVGYCVEQRKTAVVTTPGLYQVKNSKGESVLHVETKGAMQDPLSGELLYVLDFSQVTEEDTYEIVGEGDKSYHFVIREDVYKDVHMAMIKALYFQRCGCALEEKYAGKFTHDACHLSEVSLWADKDKKFECTGGWHDAGDYGRYITPAAATIAYLLYAYKKYPNAFKEELNIPESGNGVADVLNECRYELEWMLKMQLADGSVYHKLTSQNHAAFVMPEDDKEPFYAFAVSSMAVADFCATMALCARIYKAADEAFACRLKEAAKKAWEWLENNPQEIFFRNPDNSHTGEYGDISDKDERLWASVEMFYLAVSDKEDPEKYRDSVQQFIKEDVRLTEFDWRDVSGFASMAILTDREKKLGEEVYNVCREAVLKEAERALALCENNAFALGMSEKDFRWGSNMVVTNRGILWCLAYELTGEDKYIQAIHGHVDYLLGKNITGYSFVTGFGENAYRYPHSRPVHMDGIEEPIPGLVSGGPNGIPRDEVAIKMIPKKTAPMKCFLDRMECYSLNEITIYWNASAVYVTAFLRR